MNEGMRMRGFAAGREPRRCHAREADDGIDAAFAPEYVCILPVHRDAMRSRMRSAPSIAR